MAKSTFHQHWHRIRSVVKSLRIASKSSRSPGTSDDHILIGELDALLIRTQEAQSSNVILRLVMECEEVCDRIDVSHDLGKSMKAKAVRVHLGSIPNLHPDLAAEDAIPALRRELKDAICNMQVLVTGKHEMAQEEVTA